MKLFEVPELIAMIIGDTLARNRRFFPDRLAITDGDRRLTHREFTGRVFQLVSALLELEFKEGDRIACVLSNIPEIIELYFAVPYAGLILVPINYRLTSREIQYQLEDSGASAVIVEEQFAEKIDTIRPELESVKRYICVGHGLAGYESYEDLLAGYPGTHSKRNQVDEKAVALITYTSGTTGRPKGVMLTHQNILCQTFGFVGFSGKWAGDGTDVIWASYPQFHVGFIGNFAGILMGMQNVVSNFDVQKVYEILDKERVTVWRTAPIMLEMTFDNGLDPKDYDLSRLSVIASAGQPTKISTVMRSFEIFPNPDLWFTSGLGMTEAFTWVNYSHISRRNLGKTEDLIRTLPLDTQHIPAGLCGPLPHVDLKIVNDTGNEVDPGTVGEIIVKGDNVMKGYWNDQEATAGVIKDGWLHTGDLGVSHPENAACLFVMGRKKDMIVSGAENVYPAEVELAIQRHPAVHSVVVFGIPDEKWGETVKAAVIIKPGEDVTEEEIIGVCRQHIASYKKPTSVYFVKEFPRNTFGKVMKKALVEIAIEKESRR